MVIRTRMVAAGAAAVLASTAAANPASTEDADSAQRATVTVDLSGTGQVVDPNVVGANHRYSYAGYGTWDTERDELDPFVVDAMREAGITNTRFPGGTVANRYHWQRAIGPQKDRVDNVSGSASSEPLANDFGPDEWGELLDATDGTGSVVVNFATGSAAEAAAFVEYMNARAGTNPDGGVAWADVRARNGHSRPYGIPYWEVANEIGFGNQAYWLGGLSEDERPSAYAFGGSAPFSGQLVGRVDDQRDEASLSTGEPGQVFAIKYAPVAPDSATIRVDGQAWQRVGNLDMADADDNVYVLDETTGEITFGDGEHGVIPVQGAQVTADYVSGPHDGFVDFYRAMKDVDPSIKVCTGFNPFRAGVQEALLTLLGSEHPYDCVADHAYRNINDATSVADYHDRVQRRVDDATAQVVDLKRAAREHSGRDVPVIVTEWSIFSRVDVAPFYQPAIGGALYYAEQLRQFIEADISFAHKHNLMAWTFSDDNPSGGRELNALLAAPPERVTSAAMLTFELMSRLGRGEVLDASVRLEGDAPRLPLTSLAVRNRNGSVHVVLINRDREAPIKTILETADGAAPTGDAVVRTLTGPDVLAVNTPENPTAVEITRRTVDQESPLTLPPLSVTVLTVQP